MIASNNIAIIGASYLQLPLIKKAKSMGYTTHVFAWANEDVGEDEADCFYPISIREKEKIANKCREIGICGVCSIASDLAAITVNYVAAELGLVGNTMAATLRSTNKFEMRKTFLQNGDPSPKCFEVDIKTKLGELSLNYPMIVKPTDRSGSRGVCKVNNAYELKRAIKIACEESFSGKALVEDYCDGLEYSVEGISYGGVHQVLAVTLKKTTGAPYFIEIGHSEPAPINASEYKKIEDVVIHALNSLGIENGASHSEIKIDSSGDIRIIEIAGRMGGDCIGSDLVYYSTGIDYVKAVIEVACGKRPDLTPKHEPMPVEIKFLMSQADIDEMKRVQRTKEFIRLVSFFPQNLGMTTDSSNRVGCYLVKNSNN